MQIEEAPWSARLKAIGIDPFTCDVEQIQRDLARVEPWRVQLRDSEARLRAFYKAALGKGGAA